MHYIFLAYADGNMAYSLKRIGRQARRLGIFDEVVLKTPEDLPDSLRNSPLMQHSYGGGYWAWKPWIILDTLQKYEDAAVCYVDAGCTLHKNREWDMYLRKIQEYDTVLFKYPDTMPVWEKYGTTSTKIRHWCKKTAILYYDRITGSEDWREDNKILGGFIWAKGKTNPVISDWLDIVMNHPEIIDDSGVFDEQFPFFVRHKHDQPMLTALANKYKSSTLVLPELLDEGPADAAVVAERARLKSFGDYIVWCVKKLLKCLLPHSAINSMKSLLKSGKKQ